MVQKSSVRSTVSSLSALPTELAHQIIDDLRVKDVLELLSYDNERVDACIISHPVCRAMFNFNSQPTSLEETRFAAQFYIAIFKEVNKPVIYDGAYRQLPCNIHCVRPKSYDLILFEMQQDIHRELCRHWNKTDLTQLGAPKYTDLEPNFRTTGLSFREMKERWESIKKAKAILFELRSSELDWAAEILKANPDILKRTLDPHQKRRVNTAHIVLRMTQGANKILRASGQKFVTSEHFQYDFFPVTPFDSALAELLTMMEKRALVGGNPLMVDTVLNFEFVALFPPSIQESLQILVDRMPHFDPSPLMTAEKKAMRSAMVTKFEGLVPRTGNTPWSEKQIQMDDVEVDGPFFTPHKTSLIKDFKRPKSCYLDPHSEGEKNWLGAFVEVYRHLKSLE